MQTVVVVITVGRRLHHKQLQQLGQVHPITKQPCPCIVINNCCLSPVCMYLHNISTYRNVTCAGVWLWVCCLSVCLSVLSIAYRGIPPQHYYYFYYYWTASGDNVPNVIISQVTHSTVSTKLQGGYCIPRTRILFSMSASFWIKCLATLSLFTQPLPHNNNNENNHKGDLQIGVTI